MKKNYINNDKTHKELSCIPLSVLQSMKKAEELFSRAGIDSPETDAYELMNHVTGLDRKDILSDPYLKLTEEDSVKYHALVADRVRRIPLQHITGRAFFYGREYKVNGNVLVPRFDTEILVEEALKVIRPDDRVLDLCTGSGCIIISLDLGDEKESEHRCFLEGVATDISPGALEVARHNADKYGVDNIKFIQGDLFNGVSGTFDVIVSNPPYIATGEIDGLDPEVKKYDPLIALDGGEDGLVFYRRIIKRSVCFLKPGGHIFLEIGYDQGKAVSGLLADEGFKDIRLVKDYGGNDRVVAGSLI